MPEIFRERGFRFFFYSNEGVPREPIHIHVEKHWNEAKFWIHPYVQVAYNEGYDSQTLRYLVATVDQRKHEIEKAWNEFFS